MAWKQGNEQQSIGDMWIQDHKELHKLDDVNELIDWNEIEGLLKNIYSSNRGRQSYHPLVMFKVLLIGFWYKLKDPGLEGALVRDILFRKFCGFSMMASTPDHSTISRFRSELVKHKLEKKLQNIVDDQLAKKGLLIKKGHSSIIDATLTRAAVQQSSSGQKRDPDATWTSRTEKNGKVKSMLGYKIHANVDEDQFVRKVAITSAQVHDSQMLESMLTGEEAYVFADSAYKSKKHDKLLSKQNLYNKIIERPYRNKPLTKKQKKKNYQRSCTRSGVERVFGIWNKHYFGSVVARFLGKAKNSLQATLMAVAYNIKRGVAIKREINICAQEEFV